MPLFMDLHTNPDGEISIEDLIVKHQADIAGQHKFGVKFKGIWVNKNKGMVFCLMEAPDKEACNAVHQHAHGDLGCNVIEVDPGDFDNFLSGSLINEHDIAETHPNRMDTGYRTFFLFERVGPVPDKYPDVLNIEKLIAKNSGTLLPDPQKSIKAVFVYASDALACSVQIKKIIDESTNNWDYRIAVVSGKPVYEDHDKFYGYATDLTKKLSLSGYNGCIRTTQLTRDLWYSENVNDSSGPEANQIDFLSIPDEKFIAELLEFLEENLTNTSLTAAGLASGLHLSRSQLFKKIKRLTGSSPNKLIREVRLRDALQQLEKNTDQISQISFNSGFNSPSYFTKVFAERFQMLPSDYLERLNP